MLIVILTGKCNSHFSKRVYFLSNRGKWNFDTGIHDDIRDSDGIVFFF